MNKINLTITNAIPVVFKHFKYLEYCINSILYQTILPNEIIIIISEYVKNNLNDEKIKLLNDKIKNKNINSIIKIYNKKQYAGKNRQIAYNLCSSDIIIYQDCDDLTHKKRNEILLYFHIKTKSPHILHGWTSDKNALNINIDINNINIGKINNSRTQNGTPFIAKYIIGKINFPNNIKGQDVKLNNLLSKKYKSILLKNNNIYVYNNHLSSWK